jgi:hypothetical protein
VRERGRRMAEDRGDVGHVRCFREVAAQDGTRLRLLRTLRVADGVILTPSAVRASDNSSHSI